jgi:hypothetical protein
MPCERSGGSNSVIYCLNSADRGAVGGLIYTTRWGFILTTSELSIDEVVSALLPILDRTGN